MILNQNEEARYIEEMLKLLSLDAKNLDLAQVYLDLSVPEDQNLLKDVVHQDFTELDLKTQFGVYSKLVSIKQRHKELAGRFIRFLTAIGGTTTRKILVYHGWQSDYHYLKDVLPTLQYMAIYADGVAWDAASLNASKFEPLIALGKKDPEIFLQMTELCYDDDACNTNMFLAGMYLYCVKPLEESDSIAISRNDHDDRAEGNPEHIRQMRDYLEARLMGNSAGLFAKNDEPEGEEEEKLKSFIRESNPRDTFPYEIRALIPGRHRHNYRMAFLPCLAFLAVEHSNRFISLIRLAAAISGDDIPNIPLDACLRCGHEWFHSHIKALEEVLWIPAEAYIRWGILRREKEVLERMTQKNPDEVCEVIKKVPAEDYAYLVAQMKIGNPQLYAKMGPALMEDYRKIAAAEDVKGYAPEADKALDYLLGNAVIQDILPYVGQWREQYLYQYHRSSRIRSYLEYGEEQLYRRALVLECLRLQNDYFYRYWVDSKLELEGVKADGDKNFNRLQIEGLLKLFKEEQIPPQYQIEYFGKVYDTIYNTKVCQDDSPTQICVNILQELCKNWHQEWLDAAEGKNLPARVLAFRVMGTRWEEYKSQLLACATERTKQGQDFLRAIYTSHPECEADILEMLKSPKSSIREIAVEVLKNWGVEKYREPLTQAMESEKTKKIKTLIQGLLAPETENGQSDSISPDDMVSNILMGGRKRRLSWLALEEIAKVHFSDGKEASDDYMAAILVSYADMGMPGINKDAAQLAAGLVPGELAAYIKEVYERWIKDGAQAKKKWVLYAAAIHGGEVIVPLLYSCIQEWPQHSRGAMAAEAVKAMALNGTSTALLLVDQIARKFKFRQVKSAAAEALDYAAKQLDISREELEDQIVPNLGFDEHMERIFDYGKRQFKVLLAPDLSLEVYDEKGKALKNLPSPGKTDDPVLSKEANEAWKLLKKQLKTVVANQKIRLEQTLRTKRRWEKSKWHALFVCNPVMHQFAVGLIWGVYVDDVLTDTFRYMEDGTYNTMEEEEYELPDTGIIGLVHPIELSEEALTTWKEQLSDYEIVQPVEQLGRPVFRVTEEEKEATELIRFGGMTLNGLSLSGKLQDMGWSRGEVLDAGCYYTFYRIDQNKGVELSFSGCYIGNENETVVVYEACFFQPDVTEKVGWRYQPVKQKLGELDAHYFSEVVLQLTRATVSSGERLPYPDCKQQS